MRAGWFRCSVRTITKWQDLDFLPRILPQRRKDSGHQLLGLCAELRRICPLMLRGAGSPSIRSHCHPLGSHSFPLFLGCSQRLPQCMASILPPLLLHTVSSLPSCLHARRPFQMTHAGQEDSPLLTLKEKGSDTHWQGGYKGWCP